MYLAFAWDESEIWKEPKKKKKVWPFKICAGRDAKMLAGSRVVPIRHLWNCQEGHRHLTVASREVASGDCQRWEDHLSPGLGRSFLWSGWDRLSGLSGAASSPSLGDGPTPGFAAGGPGVPGPRPPLGLVWGTEATKPLCSGVMRACERATWWETLAN